MSFFNVTNKSNTKKHNGTIVLNDEQVQEIAKNKSFNSKFELFCFGIKEGWSKATIMKYCLETNREQYFYNYYTKYLANKNNK